ncbi:ABC transporter permease [Fundicoccus culcitae]|uniref:Iron export ABC transporter permease subunit FetB n=1 Tax=Fundicoccus culcitae TaxID=2969821 RepID=A0ABY5P4Y0_9LACT|nr:iron export ABC transporter permease subunit FetB [Fundicoccus culcitae]UUX33797.1 iron export ABC transporter permease subunit FetB [Fundicoccus culcitae]
MEQNLQVSPLSLVLTFSLVFIALFISYREKLGLEKDILVAIIRMIIQLSVVGFVLTAIFSVDNTWITLGMVLIIIINAAWNAAQRAKGIEHAFRDSFISIFVTTAISLVVIVISGSVEFIPSQIIPISGMIVGTVMTSVGLTYSNMRQLYADRQQAVIEMLALGATPRQASQGILRDTIRQGLQPTIDSTRMVGLVTLPGMMSGMIFAGVEPTKAIMYQMMVMIVMVAATALSVFLAAYLTFGKYFSSRYQLKTEIWE